MGAQTFNGRWRPRIWRQNVSHISKFLRAHAEELKELSPVGCVPGIDR